MKYPTVHYRGPNCQRKLWEENGCAIFRFRSATGSGEAGYYYCKDDTAQFGEAYHPTRTFANAYYQVTGKAWVVPPDVLDLYQELDAEG